MDVEVRTVLQLSQRDQKSRVLKGNRASNKVSVFIQSLFFDFIHSLQRIKTNLMN